MWQADVSDFSALSNLKRFLYILSLRLISKCFVSNCSSRLQTADATHHQSKTFTVVQLEFLHTFTSVQPFQTFGKTLTNGLIWQWNRRFIHRVCFEPVVRMELNFYCRQKTYRHSYSAETSRAYFVFVYQIKSRWERVKIRLWGTHKHTFSDLCVMRPTSVLRLTEDVDASLVGCDSQRAAAVLHGGPGLPDVPGGVVAFHRAQLVPPIIASYGVQVRVHAYQSCKTRKKK